MPVALKIYFLPRIPINTMHQIAREIQIQLAVQHRHVLALYGAFQDSKRLVLVTELAARGDLYGLKSAMDRPLTEIQVRQVVLEPLLDAWAYLHGKGVCHRDIKAGRGRGSNPSNPSPGGPAAAPGRMARRLSNPVGGLEHTEPL
jgi:aurora kinase